MGSTSDLERRLNDHNRGKQKFTRTGMPWELVFAEHFEELAMAKRRELEIKKKKSRKYIELFISSAG